VQFIQRNQNQNAPLRLHHGMQLSQHLHQLRLLRARQPLQQHEDAVDLARIEEALAVGALLRDPVRQPLLLPDVVIVGGLVHLGVGDGVAAAQERRPGLCGSLAQRFAPVDGR